MDRKHSFENSYSDQPRQSDDDENEANSTMVRLRLQSSWDDVRSFWFWRGVIAEFVGTGFLVFLGGACCLGQELDVPRIAFGFGFAVATLVWCIQHISGGHINPAVTVAMLVTRKISLVRCVAYFVVQTIGGIFGTAFLKSVIYEGAVGQLGMTQIHANMNEGDAFGCEFFITFILVFTIFAAVDEHRTDQYGSRPLAIGLAVMFCHFAFIPVTGSSMNPARSFGPAVIMGDMTNNWLYWFGPILGGCCGGLLYEFVFASNTCRERIREYFINPLYDGSRFPPHVLQGEKVLKATLATQAAKGAGRGRYGDPEKTGGIDRSEPTTPIGGDGVNHRASVVARRDRPGATRM